MAIVPYQKLSDEEVRKRVKLNRENGESEPGSAIELDLPSEEPEYHQWESKEQMEASFQSIKESWNKLLEPQIKVDNSSEAMEREYKTYEYKESVDTESEVEKGEFFIGRVKEISSFSWEKNDEKLAVGSEQLAEKGNAETVTDKVPSSLVEFTADVDFGKWGKKGVGVVFGFFKGLVGGLFNVTKEATKVEKPKTEADLKAEKKNKEQAAEKSAYYNRLEKTMAEARGAVQNTVSKVMVRLGLAGIGAEGMNAYMGENRNLNSEEITVYSAFEVARKAEEAKKKQEKQVKDMEMAQSTGPAVNIDAAVEGGTGGGKANLSAVSAGG